MSPTPTVDLQHGMLTVLDVYDLAFWCQWRLAIQAVCARFEGAAAEEGVRARERMDQASVERMDQASAATLSALRAEVDHLESQLGRCTSMNAKLEEALSASVRAVAQAEATRLSAAAAAERIKVQLSREVDAATVSASEQRDRLAHANTMRACLEASVRESEAARIAAESEAANLSASASKLQTELGMVLSENSRLEGDSRTGRARLMAVEEELSTIHDKYSALKKRFLEAGRKVDGMRAERDVLRKERAGLEDKLADVENFQRSERGAALNTMERALAAEKLARVELEADRDDLQSQLAAVLQVSERR